MSTTEIAPPATGSPSKISEDVSANPIKTSDEKTASSSDSARATIKSLTARLRTFRSKLNQYESVRRKCLSLIEKADLKNKEIEDLRTATFQVYKLVNSFSKTITWLEKGPREVKEEKKGEEEEKTEVSKVVSFPSVLKEDLENILKSSPKLNENFKKAFALDKISHVEKFLI